MQVKPGCYERDPAWVPFTQEQAWALMGSTEKERLERRAAYRKACGIKEPDKRKGMK